MLQRFTTAFLALVLLAAAPVAAQAQQGAVEFGLDAGLIVNINNDTDNLTTVCVPCQRFRIGFFVSDQIQFEPSVALNIVSASGETLTTFNGGASLLFHFTDDPDRARVYFRGGAEVAVIDLGEFTASQFGVGGGLGVKAPVGDRFAARLEATAAYSFENEGDGIPSSFGVGGLVGISFFTK